MSIAAILAAVAAVAAGFRLSPFEKDGLFGYQDSSGTVAIPASFEHVEDFTACGIAAVYVNSKEGWRYIDAQGKVLKGRDPFIFENGADYFQEGLARFTRKGRVGFIDECGRIVIPPKFDWASPFKDGAAEVCRDCRPVHIGEHVEMKGGTWWRVDRRGRKISRPR